MGRPEKQAVLLNSKQNEAEKVICVLGDWESPENLGKRKPEAHLHLGFLLCGRINGYSFFFFLRIFKKETF